MKEKENAQTNRYNIANSEIKAMKTVEDKEEVEGAERRLVVKSSIRFYSLPKEIRKTEDHVGNIEE